MMIVDHNQPDIGIAHIVCMYITGKVICKCKVEQNMTVYQIGNCLTTVIAEALHVPRVTINLLWKPKMYGEMEVTVVISLLQSLVSDILNYDPLHDPQVEASEDGPAAHCP